MTEGTKPQCPPDTIELLPCPFCGEMRVSLNEPNEHNRYGSINCPACLAVMPGALKDKDQGELVACWNTRATPTASGGDAQGGGRDIRNAALEEAAQYHDRAAADCRAIALVNLDNDLGADSETNAIDHEIAAEDIREMKIYPIDHSGEECPNFPGCHCLNHCIDGWKHPSPEDQPK
jgi:hypothetical protein